MIMTCSRCGEPGHNVRTCCVLDDDPRIIRIAELRQDTDARASEVAQYERAIGMMRDRIDVNRRAMADNAIAIHQLRERST